MLEDLMSKLKELDVLSGCEIVAPYMNKIGVSSELVNMWISIVDLPSKQVISLESIDVAESHKNHGVLTNTLKCMYDICDNVIIANVLTDDMVNYCESHGFDAVDNFGFISYRVKL